MAKWGEGDPRWLVEERPDATNVNNWHWAEKNASHWSRDKLKEVLVGTKIETDLGKCEVTEVSKCEGDAVVNNRKGKLIYFYEWDIEVKWKGFLIGNETEVKGSIQVPNLSEEHEINEVDVNVCLDSPGPEADVLKEMLRITGAEVIRQKLSSYLSALKNDFAKGLILPTKDSSNSAQFNSEKINKKVEVSGKSPAANSSKPEKFETTELKTVESFKCTAEEFYRTLTVKELVQAFTHGDCVLEPVEGGKFQLFDGNVQGNFVQLIPNKLIKQKWRFKTWPQGHFSDVTIDIDQKVDCTEVSVTQVGIPKTEIENTREGWKRFYWESMKRTFGFGAILF